MDEEENIIVGARKDMEPKKPMYQFNLQIIVMKSMISTNAS